MISSQKVNGSSPQICEGRARRLDDAQTDLKVPTPPASSKKAVCVNGLSTHLSANALKICPCATTRTSQFDAVSSLGFPIDDAWYLVLISWINLSSRSTICSGDLFQTRLHQQTSSVTNSQGENRHTPHPDIHPSKYPKDQDLQPFFAPESPWL